MTAPARQTGMILLSCLIVLSLLSLMLMNHLQTLVITQRRDAYFMQAQQSYFSGLRLLKNLPHRRHPNRCLSTRPVMLKELIQRSQSCIGSTQNNTTWYYYREQLDQDSYRGTVYYFVLPTKIWMAQIYWHQLHRGRRVVGWFEKLIRI
jgi:hypothetical protein